MEPQDGGALTRELKEVRRLGEKHVWGPLQQPPTADGRQRQLFRVGYERFLAAANTEIAFGPEIVPALYKRLADIAASEVLPVEMRCDALDLVGQFGLPPLAPALSAIEKALANESNSNIQASLASLRVRQRICTDQDVVRLQQSLVSLALACFALMRLTDAQYSPPIPQGWRTEADLFQRIVEEAPAVRAHLQRWH